MESNTRKKKKKSKKSSKSRNRSRDDGIDASVDVTDSQQASAGKSWKVKSKTRRKKKKHSVREEIPNPFDISDSEMEAYENLDIVLFIANAAGDPWYDHKRGCPPALPVFLFQEFSDR